MVQHQLYTTHASSAIGKPAGIGIGAQVLFVCHAWHTPLIIAVYLNIAAYNVGYAPRMPEHVVACFGGREGRIIPEFMDHLPDWLWSLAVVTDCRFDGLLVAQLIATIDTQGRITGEPALCIYFFVIPELGNKTTVVLESRVIIVSGGELSEGTSRGGSNIKDSND